MRHVVEISADSAKAVMEKAAGRTAGESWHLTDAVCTVQAYSAALKCSAQASQVTEMCVDV